MKKILIPLLAFSLIFSSCKTSQLQSYQDDVYVNPSEEKKLVKIAEAEKAKQEAAEKQKQVAAALDQKAKDDANPYYQDPKYNSDDYYDYKYASSMRRFQNPLMGAGYYSNYYTNSYMYNQNPAMYGSSIYSSYNWWSPSNQFNNYGNGLSLGISSGNSYGNVGYNSYGYNPYYSNNYYGCSNYGGYGSYGYNPYGFNSYGYNSYANGYMNGYNNGFNNGFNWGYFNSYDVNSSYSKMEYGPRGSNGGGNSNRQTTAGMLIPEGENARNQFIHAVSVQQENAPRFTDTHQRAMYNSSVENNNGQNISSESIKTKNYSPNENTHVNSNTSSNTSTGKLEGFWPRINNNQNSNYNSDNNLNTNNPVRGNNSGTEKIKSSSFENTNFNNSGNSERMNNSGNSNSGGSQNGGSSSPRGGGGGGSNNPR